MDEFEEWYKIYPRHRDKLAAMKAYKKARLLGATAEQLKHGAEQYAKEQASQDPQFTKYPATWLNRGGWMDEPDAKKNTFNADAFKVAWDIRSKQQSSDDVRYPPRKDH